MGGETSCLHQICWIKYLTYESTTGDYGRARRRQVTLLLPTLHRDQTLAVQLQQMRRVFFWLGRRAAAGKADAAAAGRLAVSRSHGNEPHQVERNIFVAAR